MFKERIDDENRKIVALSNDAVEDYKAKIAQAQREHEGLLGESRSIQESVRGQLESQRSDFVREMSGFMKGMAAK